MGVKNEDVKDWIVAHNLFTQLFDARTTHVELLKRSGEVIRFAATVAHLTLDNLNLVWDASQSSGDETQGTVFKVLHVHNLFVWPCVSDEVFCTCR